MQLTTTNRNQKTSKAIQRKYNNRAQSNTNNHIQTQTTQETNNEQQTNSSTTIKTRKPIKPITKKRNTPYQTKAIKRNQHQ